MDDFYRHRYKKMMLIPLLLFIPLIIAVFVFPGVSPGTDLTGGNVLIIRSDKALTETGIRDALAEFNLPELKVSTIASPTGFGAWISYSKDPIVARAEDAIGRAQDLISSAAGDTNSQTTITPANEAASIALSNQALTDLGMPTAEFKNSKLALLAAQDGLAAYKENFSGKLQNALTQKLGLGVNAEFQKREVSATMGVATTQSAIFIMLVGMIFIIIVIFLAFRQFIPSVAIIQCMFFDALCGMAGMVILNIPLSLTTIPAILMLIGYSVDTDIMLTSRMLKGKDGTPAQRATASMITGITMTGTTIAALISMLVVSYFYQIQVIYEISAILLFGLIGDMTATWLLNAPILLWFVERRNRQ